MLYVTANEAPRWVRGAGGVKLTFPQVRVLPLIGDTDFNYEEVLFTEHMERFFTRNMVGYLSFHTLL